MQFIENFLKNNRKRGDDDKKKIMIVSMVIVGALVVFVALVDIGGNISSVYSTQVKENSVSLVYDKAIQILNDLGDKMQSINEKQ